MVNIDDSFIVIFVVVIDVVLPVIVIVLHSKQPPVLPILAIP